MYRIAGSDRQRDAEPEGCAFAFFADDPDRASHQLDQAARNGEAQPRAAEHAVDRAIRLAEPLKQPMLLVLGDAGARIGNGEVQCCRIGRRGGLRCGEHHGTCLGEFHGIVEKVEQHLPQPRFVADQLRRKAGRDPRHDRQALRIGAAVGEGNAGLDQGRDIKRRPVEFDGAGLDLGEIEDVVEHRQQGTARRGDQIDLALLFGAEPFRTGQEIDETDDAVQGRPNFVAHRGEEIGLGLIGKFGAGLREFGQGLGNQQFIRLALAFGHVPDHGDHVGLARAGGFEQRIGDFHPNPVPQLVPQAVDAGATRRLSVESLGQRRDRAEIVRVDQLFVRHGLEFVQAVAPARSRRRERRSFAGGRPTAA